MPFNLIYEMLILSVITYLLTKLFIYFTPKLNLLDTPNHRSSHKTPIPRGAGIVFGAIFFIALIIKGFIYIEQNYFIILAIFIVYVVGTIDDFKNLQAKTKLIFILIASSILYFNGYEITSIGTYFGYTVELGILAFPFTIFAVVAFTNAINLTDGLDGLAGSVSLVILFTILYIGLIHDDKILIYWSTTLIAILIGFLFLNWYPAKVFMGDSGSLFLGFIISFLALQALPYLSPTSILFFAALPILDTLIVFRRRRQRGQSPFTADKNHIHHILLNTKRDKTFTVRMLLLIQLSFSATFLQLYNQNDFLNLITFILLFVLFFNLFDPRIRKRPNNSYVRKKHRSDIRE